MSPAVDDPSGVPLPRRLRPARAWAAAVVLLTLAWLSAAIVAPGIGELRPDQRLVTLSSKLAAVRDRPDASPRNRQLIGRRTDQVLLVAGDIAVVQGSSDWITAGGRETLVESSGLYGVHRRSRANQPGYGDQEREGQYAFPAPAPRANVLMWDPSFRAPWRARFEQLDRVQGMPAYRYAMEVPAHDDTGMFLDLAGVPERWRIETEASGTLWVEPVSGVILERSLRGTSWFVTADGRARVSEALSWRSSFTPETRQQQLETASRERSLRLAFAVWVPRVALALALLAVGLALYGTWRRRA